MAILADKPREKKDMKRTRRRRITIENHRVTAIRIRGEQMFCFCEHCGRETAIVAIGGTANEKKLMCSGSMSDETEQTDDETNYEK